jgi:hypothetical protein
MEPEFALAMAGAATAHQAASASREENSQQRAGRTRRTNADPQQAQQRATADAAAAPAALDSLSRLQQLAHASPQVAQLRRLQALADSHYAPVSQLAGGPEEGELVQGKFGTAQLQPQLQQAPRTNNTGLPDQLKSGIESLSGLSMDHVRVHYNSSQPAQLNALAYAQGSDIHLAPGQERHLPHEAWHVVQQAQGRVRPTMQMKDGVPVNDDKSMEHEADVMGGRAASVGKAQENKSHMEDGATPQQKDRRDFAAQVVDNRAESIALRGLQEMADNSQVLRRLKTLQALSGQNTSSRVKCNRSSVVQREVKEIADSSPRRWRSTLIPNISFNSERDAKEAERNLSERISNFTPFPMAFGKGVPYNFPAYPALGIIPSTQVDGVGKKIEKAKSMLHVLSPENRLFNTKEEERKPTLYFGSKGMNQDGNKIIETGRVRQQHDDGPAVYTDETPRDDLFSNDERILKARNQDNVKPMDVVNLANAQEGMHHIEIEHTGNDAWENVHASGGTFSSAKMTDSEVDQAILGAIINAQDEKIKDRRKKQAK